MSFVSSLLIIAVSRTKLPAVPNFEVAQEIARAVCFEKYDQSAVLIQFPFVGRLESGKWKLSGRPIVTEFFAVLGKDMATTIDAKTGKIEGLHFGSWFDGQMVERETTALAIVRAIGAGRFGKEAMSGRFPWTIKSNGDTWQFRQLSSDPVRLTPKNGTVRIDIKASDGTLLLIEKRNG
jgi:hypothetical protein